MLVTSHSTQGSSLHNSNLWILSTWLWKITLSPASLWRWAYKQCCMQVHHDVAPPVLQVLLHQIIHFLTEWWINMLIKKAVDVNLAQSMLKLWPCQWCKNTKFYRKLRTIPMFSISFSGSVVNTLAQFQHTVCSVWPSLQSLWLCWTLPDLHVLSVRLISEQNLLQAWDTTAFLKDCSYTNPKQKINSCINCWACLADQSFAITIAREHWRQHVYSYLPAAKLE